MPAVVAPVDPPVVAAAEQADVEPEGEAAAAAVGTAASRVARVEAEKKARAAREARIESTANSRRTPQRVSAAVWKAGKGFTKYVNLAELQRVYQQDFKHFAVCENCVGAGNYDNAEVALGVNDSPTAMATHTKANHQAVHHRLEALKLEPEKEQRNAAALERGDIRGFEGFAPKAKWHEELCCWLVGAPMSMLSEPLFQNLINAVKPGTKMPHELLTYELLENY